MKPYPMKTIRMAARCALFAAALCCAAARGEGKPFVFFLHGWTPGYQPKNTSPVPRLFKENFPGYEIGVRAWKSSASFVFFIRVMKNADAYADELAEEIAAMPPERQRDLILVGHSLGGRIAVRAAAKLRRRNIRIRRFILLAAAIDANDPDIAAALDATLLPNVNVYNPEDRALRNWYPVVGGRALGVTGYRGKHPRLRQYRVGAADRVEERWHAPANYFSRLLKVDRKDLPPDDTPAPAKKIIIRILDLFRN